MLDQRRRRWADIVQMLYKCFVFAVIISNWSLNGVIGYLKVPAHIICISPTWSYISLQRPTIYTSEWNYSYLLNLLPKHSQFLDIGNQTFHFLTSHWFGCVNNKDWNECECLTYGNDTKKLDYNNLIIYWHYIIMEAREEEYILHLALYQHK